MLCRPDEQKRLIVSADTRLGKPARRGNHACHIHTLLTLREGATQDNIIDFGRIKGRRAP